MAENYITKQEEKVYLTIIVGEITLCGMTDKTSQRTEQETPDAPLYTDERHGLMPQTDDDAHIDKHKPHIAGQTVEYASYQSLLLRETRQLSVGREGDTSHTLAVGEVVNHIGMSGFKCIGNRLWCINGDLDGVGVFRLSKILDGEGVVLRGEFQVGRTFCSINEEFIVLRSLHLNLSFQVVTIIDIEGEQTHTTAFL